jgi:hypothetical protein
MGNISIKLNLEGLKHVKQTKKGKDGKDILCLVIPIEANHLYAGAKGTYLDLQGFEIRNPKEGSKDTHLVKQSLPKEVYGAMSEQERNSTPILGNLIVWGGQSQSQAVEVVQAEVIGEHDDLPF